MRGWKGTIPIYINNRNWLTSTREMADFFAQVPRCEVIIVDNASTYEPLLDWYNQGCPYKVVRLPQNSGSHAPWTSGAVLPAPVHRAWFGSDYYVVTDPDLRFEGCPRDVLDVLVDGYEAYPEITKVGVSLEITDIPQDAISAREVVAWESQFWTNRRDGRFFNAGVDTTFALYGVGIPCKGNCLRADRPYTARHLPWYFTLDSLTEEQTYYLQNATNGHWSKIFKQKCSDWNFAKSTHSNATLLADAGQWSVTDADRQRFAPDWAISREFQSVLPKLLACYRPKTIVETGPGLSTLILQRYAKINADVRTTHVEHSGPAYDSLVHILSELGLFPERLHSCPLVDNYYEGIKSLISRDTRIDLLVLDGPVGENQRASPAAMDFIRRCVGNETIVIQDDTHRGSESSVIRQIKDWWGGTHHTEWRIQDTVYPWRISTLLIPTSATPDPQSLLSSFPEAKVA